MGQANMETGDGAALQASPWGFGSGVWGCLGAARGSTMLRCRAGERMGAGDEEIHCSGMSPKGGGEGGIVGPKLIVGDEEE